MVKKSNAAACDKPAASAAAPEAAPPAAAEASADLSIADQSAALEAGPAEAGAVSDVQIEERAAQKLENAEDGVRPVREVNPGTGAIVPIDELLAHRDQVEGAVGIRVVGPTGGRRRAGRAFGPEAEIIALEALDDEQLLAIDADPALSWSLVQLEAEG